MSGQRPPSGNRRLPTKRHGGYRETPDVTAAISRLIRSVGKRLAGEDPVDLAHLQQLEDELTAAWATAVAGLRKTGYSDRDIGAQLGCTRQNVEKRWPRDREVEL